MISTEERFWAKVEKTDGCWNWMGSKNERGYGNFYFGGKSGRAYKYSYILHGGAIPEKYEIDHLCRNTSCVNPDHLEAVTHQENMRRGMVLKRKPFCRLGHPLSGKNLLEQVNQYGTVTGRCRECSNLRYQRKLEEKKQ